MGDHTTTVQQIQTIITRTNLIKVVSILIIFGALYLISIINYLLFHSIVEIAGITVAFSIFIIAWNTKKEVTDGFFLIIGISFLFLGSIDLFHTIVYKGMGVFPGNNSDLPTQLWIAARSFQSITFLIATFFIGKAISRDRRYDAGIIMAAGLGVWAVLISSIFVWQNFPHGYIEGTGLTQFKIISEYVISSIFIVTIIILYLKREHFDRLVWKLLVAAEVFLILGELAFTSYGRVYGEMNFLGHLFRLISVYLFYRAFVVVGLTRPYDLILHDLKEKEDALQESEEQLRSVFDQANHLMGVLDRQGNLMKINTTAVRYLEAEEIDTISVLGKPFWLTPWWTHDIVLQEQLKRAIPRVASGEVVHFETTHTSGKGPVNIDFSLKPVKNKNGNVFLLIAEGWDLTERKRTEEAVWESLLGVEEAMDQGRMAYWEHDILTNVFTFNDRLYTLLGTTAEREGGYQMSAESFTGEFVHPDDRGMVTGEIEKSKNASYPGDYSEVEYRIMKRDGEVRYVVVRNRIIEDTNSHTIKSHGTIQDITERKRMEDALRESENKLNTIIRGSPIPQFVIDNKHRVIHWNEALEKYSGIKAKNVIGTNRQWQTFYPYEHPCMADLLVDGAIERLPGWDRGEYVKSSLVEDAYEATGFFPHLGSGVWLHFTAAPIRDIEGRIIGAVETLEDVTGQKTAEEALKESEERLMTIIEQSPFSIQVISPDGLTVQVNHAFEELWGMSLADLDTYNILEDEQLIRFGIMPDIRKGFSGEMITLPPVQYDTHTSRKSNEKRWVQGRLYPVRDTTGIIRNVILMHEEITERKRAEDELRESEGRLHSLIQAIPDLIWLKDVKGVYQSCNPMFERFFGAKEADIIGKTDSDFLNPEMVEFFRDHDRKAIEAGITRNEEWITFADDGHRALLDTIKTPMYDTRGTLVGILGIGRDITARKQIEDELRESEERFRTMSETSLTGIYIFVDGVVKYANPTFARILGYTPQEIIGMDPLSYIHPDDRAMVRDKITARTDYKDTISVYESRMVTKENRIIFVNIMGTMIPYEGRLAISGNLMDITRQKLAGEALRESEIRFRELFNSMSSGVAVYRAVDGGADFVFVDFNHGAEIIEKTTKQDLIGRRIGEVFPGVSEFGIMEVLRRVWHTGRPERLPVSLYKDQRIASWRENFVYRLPSGEVVAIYDDVTERKRAEEALIESEQKFRDIFNNTTDAIYLHGIGDDGTAGRFTEVNDVICRMLGYTREEMLTKTPFDIVTGYYYRSGETILETQQTAGIASFETEYRRNDGTNIPVEVNTHVVTIQGTRVMLGVIRNITERKLAEEAIRQVNKKLNLLSSITRHDINNQLTSLVGYLELTKETLGDRSPVSGYISKVEQAAETIEHQIIFTKEYQDMGVNAPDWQGIDAVVKTAQASLPMRNVQVVMDCPDLEVYADPLFEKVFYNLIDNALRYGGPDMSMIRISLQDSEKGAAVFVEDDGNGISDEDKKRLFERGFGHHTGLGLFLSREILSITGITITETGEPDKGARFEIFVPKGLYRFREER